MSARDRVFQLRLDGLFDLRGERRIIGDQNRLRAGIVFGLRQKIRRDPIGIACLVGEDQDLGWSGDHVDTDFAEHQPLRGSDICIARSDNLGNGRDAFGAVSERSHGLCAADAIDLVDAGEFGRRQHQAD